MNSRERVRRAVNHQQPDRVPLDLGSVESTGIAASAYAALKAHLGMRVEKPVRVSDVFQMLADVETEVVERLHVDFEAALGLEHTEMLQRLDDFSLEMIEQPLAAHDPVGHAMIQESVRTPLCLDEGVSSVEEADIALELHSCRFMNVEPGRVGALSRALR